MATSYTGKAIERLLSDDYVTTLTPSGNLSINGTEYKTEAEFFSFITTNVTFIWNQKHNEIFGQLNMMFSTKILNGVKNRIKAQNPNFASNGTYDMTSKIAYTDYIQLRDMRSGIKIMWDTTTDKYADLDPSVWEAQIPKLTPEIKEARFLPVLLKYNPRSTTNKRKVEYGSSLVYEVNTYVRPSWMDVSEFKDKPNELFFKLLSHLFPNKECQKYVVYWIYTAMKHRNQTYLLLNSGMGTGKGTLAQLIENLIGADNTFKTSEEFFDTRFNGELYQKRLVFFDEVPINSHTRTKLKYYANDRIHIEQKGQEPRYMDNFASFVIASNHDHNAQLMSNDRRFSVPEITDARLDVDTATSFHKLIKNKGELAAIGNWILIQGEKMDKAEEFSPFLAYKTKKFHKLCINALSDWQTWTIRMLQNPDKLPDDLKEQLLEDEHKRIPLKEFQKQFKRENGADARIGGESKMRGFLNDQLDENGQPYGEIRRKDGFAMVKFMDKYCVNLEEEFGKTTEPDEEDWEDL